MAASAKYIGKGSGTLVTLDLTLEIDGGDGTVKPGSLCEFLVVLLGEPS